MTDFISLPFSELLLWLYKSFNNYGLAIIVFAVVIKLIFLPFQMKSKRSTMRMGRLNPYMKELEKKHGDDKAKYQAAVAKLYKDEGINPMSGCLWSLLPMLIMFLMYPIIRQPLTSLMRIGAEALTAVEGVIQTLGLEIPSGAYAQIGMTDIIHNNFSAFQGISDKLIDIDFGFLGINLGIQPSYNVFAFSWSNSAELLPQLGLFLVPVISGLMSYFSMKISMASNPAAAQQQGSMKSMNVMMPAMSVVFGFLMPAALGIYWIINSVLGLVQDLILNKHYGKILDAEDAERRERLRKQEEELERKRLETERLRELGATERNKNTSKKKLQAAEKAKLEERLAQEKAEKRAAMGISDDKPASQVGTRRYARGRAYVADRYSNPEGAEEKAASAAALSELDEQLEQEFDAAVDESAVAEEASGEVGAVEEVSEVGESAGISEE